MAIGMNNVVIRTQMVHFSDRVCVDGYVTGSLGNDDLLHYGDEMTDCVRHQWVQEAIDHPFLDVYGPQMTFYASQKRIDSLSGPYMNMVVESGLVEMRAVDTVD